MLLSRYPKSVQFVIAIVGASIACGVFLGLGVVALEKDYSSVLFRLVGFGLYLLLAAMTFCITIDACKKILKLIP
jgi:hypothetical protein